MLIVWALSRTPLTEVRVDPPKSSPKMAWVRMEESWFLEGCCAVGWGSLAALSEVITRPRWAQWCLWEAEPTQPGAQGASRPQLRYAPASLYHCRQACPGH